MGTQETDATIPQESQPVPVAPALKRKLRFRLVGLITVCLLILAGAAYGTYAVWQYYHKDSASSIKSSNSKADQPKLKSPTIATSGNPTLPTMATLQAQLKTATTNQQKSDIYLQLVGVGTATNESSSQVIGYAASAELLAPSYHTAFVLAQLYEDAGNKPQALTNYKLYLARMSSDYKSAHSGEYDYYAQHVQDLESQP